MEAFIRPGIGYKHWTSHSNYPLVGVVPTGRSKMSIFVHRVYIPNPDNDPNHPTAYIKRLTLRTDGFVSVNDPYAGGEMITKPLRFTGNHLEINYSTSAPGFVRVETQDANGKPFPGFSLAEYREIIGDKIGRVVSWKHGSDVSELAGKPVRLHFAMKDADLYSLLFH